MESRFYIQDQAVALRRMIPRVPRKFHIDPKFEVYFVHFAGSDEFIQAFGALTFLMKRIYQDVERRPLQYGMPLSQVGQGTEKGNPATAAMRALRRVGDVIQVLGEVGEMEGTRLRIHIPSFRGMLRKTANAELITSQLLEHGFSIAGFENGRFARGLAETTVEYAENPAVLSAIKAYALSSPFREYDVQEFYTFDYKRLADRKKLPKNAVAADYARLLPKEDATFFIAFYNRLMRSRSCAFILKENETSFFYKQTRMAKYEVDFLNMKPRLYLRLREIERYAHLIRELPAPLKEVFYRDSCTGCGDEEKRKGPCKFRVFWCIDGINYTGCSHVAFTFSKLESEDANKLAELVCMEYDL